MTIVNITVMYCLLSFVQNTVCLQPDGIVEDIGDAISKLEDVVNKSITKTKTEIDLMVEKAQDLGVDVSECVKGIDRDLSSIVMHTTGPLMKCMLDKICEAKVILEQAVEDIKKYANVVNEMQGKIAGCGSGLGSAKCLAAVLADIIKISAKLPIEITQQVRQILALLTTVEEAVTQCGTNAAINAGKQCGAIALDVGKCISGKINVTRF